MNDATRIDCIHRYVVSFADEYATYIRLIDEILEQRYNYVIQSRRTIETFPVRISQYRVIEQDFILFIARSSSFFPAFQFEVCRS
jgi:hypothetical protein